MKNNDTVVVDPKSDSKKSETNKASTGDAGFGVDVGVVDKRNYIND